MEGTTAPAPLSPGKAWAAKSLRSGFGDQPLSHRASAPAAGFGSSSRDAYSKQYASAEANRAAVRSRGNIDNPLGACYAVPDTLAKQVLSTLPSPPRVRFGTGKRPGMAEKTDAPGPGAYKLKPAMGADGAICVLVRGKAYSACPGGCARITCSRLPLVAAAVYALNAAADT